MTATQFVAGQRITAAALNSNVPQAWQAITPLASWTTGGGLQVPFRARLFNSVTVHLQGSLSGGTITSATQIGTLPSGLIPALTQICNGVSANPSGEYGDSFELAMYGSTGAISIFGVATGTTSISFDALFALD